jgi:ABC-type sugar transport system ATPase subunit
MSEALLTVDNVSKRFGGVQALSGISLSVAPGESVALLGGNGAGKSTLVSIISGLQRPDEGVVSLNGEPVRFASPDDARAVGIETVFQTLGLCENLDAPGNLFLGRELAWGRRPFRFLRRRAMERETRATLQELSVNVPDLKAATAGLSGGQRQALAFARAARASSRLLILDEPTAALGVEERRRVIETVDRLRKERGMAVLLVTHNLVEMRQLADRVVVLRRGEHAGTARLADVDDDHVVGLITGARA